MTLIEGKYSLTTSTPLLAKGGTHDLTYTRLFLYTAHLVKTKPNPNQRLLWSLLTFCSNVVIDTGRTEVCPLFLFLNQNITGQIDCAT